jgi:4-hydroxybenzoate polyprenyltransferase
MSAAGKLRVIQLACILLVLGCMWASRLPYSEWRGTLTAVDWLFIVAAIWSAISGFTLQRRIVIGPTRSRGRSSKSTPFGRWKAGNVVRLWLATNVGLCAYGLRVFAGPPWLVNVFFGVALLLLIAWTPGTSPVETTS